MAMNGSMPITSEHPLVHSKKSYINHPNLPLGLHKLLLPPDASVRIHTEKVEGIEDLGNHTDGVGNDIQRAWGSDLDKVV